MTSPSKLTTSPIQQLCESLEKIAREASAADAAVTAASEEYKIAKIDDGETDPAEIFERKTAAKKKLFIRESEAKRAQSRLKTATSDFETSIENLTGPLLEDLAKIRDRNAAQLTKELAPKLPQNDLAISTLKNFVGRCNGVMDFDIAIGSIHQGIQRLNTHGPQTSGLIRALKQAEILL